MWMLKIIFPKNRLLQFLFYHGEKVLYREKSRLDIKLLDEELYVEIFKFWFTIFVRIEQPANSKYNMDCLISYYVWVFDGLLVGTFSCVYLQNCGFYDVNYFITLMQWVYKYSKNTTYIYTYMRTYYNKH